MSHRYRSHSETWVSRLHTGLGPPALRRIAVSSAGRRDGSLCADLVRPDAITSFRSGGCKPIPGSMVLSACEGQRRAMGQLGRILLSGSSGSQDEQWAAPQGSDSYGELMDEIDRLIENDQRGEPDRRDR